MREQLIIHKASRTNPFDNILVNLKQVQWVDSKRKELGHFKPSVNKHHLPFGSTFLPVIFLHRRGIFLVLPNAETHLAACDHLGTVCSTHCSGDWEETVVADEHDAEDRCGAEQVVGDQPQLAQPPTQSPPACQDVGDVDGDAKCPCTVRKTPESGTKATKHNLSISSHIYTLTKHCISLDVMTF